MQRNKNARLGYTAGIIDGEGCISIAKYTKVGKASVYHSLQVQVGSTDEWLCQWLKMQYGGCVSYRPSSRPRWNDAWNWSVSGRKAAEFLKLLLPYLQLKRPQAEIALEFYASFRKSKKESIDNPLTEEEVAVREAQRLVLMGMHSQKGKGG